MGVFRIFFTQTRLYRHVPYSMHKKFKPFNFLFIKSQKLHGDSAKNDSARAPKLEGEGRLTPRPQPLQG